MFSIFAWFLDHAERVCRHSCCDVVQTPTMTVPLLPDCDASAAKLLTARMRRLKLAETLKGIKVRIRTDGGMRKAYAAACSLLVLAKV